ncbi:MAG TPA: 1-deoxy-D-xylulose-5-phosphate synthase, partial [Roseimicrobium sp.]|nr:1-deoxy-D-xylulose-5-phosphate synthase [Roseimicrobium sp.]
FGDAALTNGISFEALNNISHTTKKFIAILNDNEWSIAKNVGAISGYLNKLITHPSYNSLRKNVEHLLGKLTNSETGSRIGYKTEEAIKGVFTEVALEHKKDAHNEGRGGIGKSLIFEEFGLRYLGPIDGHDLPTLIKALEFAKQCEEPVVLHVLTQKGKGFDAALQHPEKFHGLGPYDIKTGATPAAKPGTPPAYQDVMGQTLVKLCQKDNSLVGITAAMPTGTGMKHLEKALPNRYYDVGIAEEHAVIFAAGMATMGFRPVVAIYSTFLQRAYDCIHHDVCLQDLPVIFCMDRAGLSANDGPTHHGLFDIAYLRCVPNLIAMSPKDEDELADMMFTATHQKHATFIRYPRGNAEGVPIKDQPALLEIGKAEVIQNFKNNGGKKVALFGLGNMMAVARQAAVQLAAEGHDVAIINPRFTKPIDAGTTLFFGQAADVVVTLEDHVIVGGYGSIVNELYGDNQVTTPVIRIAWPDQFIEHASSVDYLRNKYGLTAENTVAKVKAQLAGHSVKSASKVA